MAYQCPLCQQPLSLNLRTYSCENNHQFDMAKEGYVNLMPAHHKRSKDPGDNKEMMQARRRFLDGGHYHPMRMKVAELCKHFLKNTNHQLLDIGCGEGYYTTYIADTLQEQSIEARTFGLDISKVAIRYAAKRYPNCDFTVASSHRLPFADDSLDGILRIYAPCKTQELNRCVKSGGVVITVTPAARHLYEFRQSIYQDVRLHEEQPEEIKNFTLAHTEKVNYMMTLSGEEAFDLLQMTPFAWRASEEYKAELKASKSLQCEADFMIRVYQKA